MRIAPFKIVMGGKIDYNEYLAVFPMYLNLENVF